MDEDINFNNGRTRGAVIRVLRYYSSFRIPLKADEIFMRLPKPGSLSLLLVVLEDLVYSKDVFYYKGYYSLVPEVKEMVMQRLAACN